jgi:hypothetical protein
MKLPTVQWLPELERTEENYAAALRAFDQQIPGGEVPIEFQQNLLARGCRLVWGWYSPSCTLLFVEPAR